jgi:heat shock protein HslJ
MNQSKLFLIILVAFSSFLGCNTTKKSTNSGISSDNPNPNSDLIETYWKLTELMGEPITMTPGTKKEMHMVIKKQDNLVNGNSGCNSFTGSYILLEGNRISFSKLAGTKMACIDMEKETTFMEALQKADNYAIQGKILSLNKGRMAPLAKFEAVYLK